MIEENGNNFSGGQKLRLSIARALIRPAEIILMDEPTSALDMDNERSIINNIYRRSHNDYIFSSPVYSAAC